MNYEQEIRNRLERIAKETSYKIAYQTLYNAMEQKYGIDFKVAAQKFNMTTFQFLKSRGYLEKAWKALDELDNPTSIK